MNAPRAGQPAQPSDLVDVAALVTAYYTREPDPDERRRAGRVRHLGAPRVEPEDVVQRGAHPGHDPGDLRVPRATRASTARCSSAATPTALSEPAWTSALEVLVANDVTVLVDSADRYTPDPRGLARDPHRQPGQGHRRRRDAGAPGLADGIVVTPSHNPPGDGGFKYNPPHGGPADSDATKVIAARANELIRGGLAGSSGVPFARARAAAIRPTTSSARYVDDLPNVLDLDAIREVRACASAPTRWAARRSTTGAPSASGTASTSPS